MISDLVKQMIENAEREKIAREFWEEVEQEAEKYDVPVHYYLAEFYWCLSLQDLLLGFLP